MTSHILNEILVLGLAIAWLLVPLHLHPSQFSEHPKFAPPLDVQRPPLRREYARAASGDSLSPVPALPCFFSQVRSS